MKNKNLPTCLQGNSRDSLGEYDNTSYSMFGAEGVKIPISLKSSHLIPFTVCPSENGEARCKRNTVAAFKVS